MDFFFPLYILTIILLHEVGHVIAAKALNLTIERIGFSIKPVPRFYVSIIDNNIPANKRLIYLLSGNLSTLLLFLVFLFSGIGSKSLYYAFSFQLVVETNPFYSDYVIAFISYIYRKDFRAFHIKRKYNAEAQASAFSIEDFKNQYMFGKQWYLHFILWSVLIIFLLSPQLLMHFINH